MALPELINRFPAIVSALDTVSVVVTVPPMVRLAQVAVAEIVGWLEPVKLPSPKMAFIVAVGTPFVQFAAVPQVLLDVPFQLVCAKEQFVINMNTDRDTESRSIRFLIYVILYQWNIGTRLTVDILF